MAAFEDEPDLMRELDEAEEIMTGRVESVHTEWGVRYQSSGREHVATYGADEQTARMAAADYKRLGGTLVRCTVTRTPWEEVPGDEQPAP